MSVGGHQSCHKIRGVQKKAVSTGHTQNPNNLCGGGFLAHLGRGKALRGVATCGFAIVSDDALGPNKHD